MAAVRRVPDSHPTPGDPALSDRTTLAQRARKSPGVASISGSLSRDARAGRSRHGEPGPDPAPQPQRLPAALGRRGDPLRPGRGHPAPDADGRPRGHPDPAHLHHPLPRRPQPRACPASCSASRSTRCRTRWRCTTRRPARSSTTGSGTPPATGTTPTSSRRRSARRRPSRSRPRRGRLTALPRLLAFRSRVRVPPGRAAGPPHAPGPPGRPRHHRPGGRRVAAHRPRSATWRLDRRVGRAARPELRLRHGHRPVRQRLRAWPRASTCW